VMGTASTMACITAALGLMPFEGASAPAVSAARIRIAEQTGFTAVAVAATAECSSTPSRSSRPLAAQPMLSYT
jgi:dihydroxy-acid dehydratase